MTTPRKAMIEFGREICGSLEIAEQQEWLVTNRIGGYASGTVSGNLTRRYHGLLIAALHYFFLITCDAIVLGAVADRPVGVIAWKIIYVGARGLITGWLLASWVCLFRQCETRRANQERWIQSEIQY